MAMGETGDLGRRIGMFMTIQGFGGLFGPPISGAINRVAGGFNAVGYYAGMCDMWSDVKFSRLSIVFQGAWS